MYAVAVLDANALATFRREHPWLSFPDDVQEVSLFLDDNGSPVRLTAMTLGADGTDCPTNPDAFGTETVLALIRYAPRGKPTTWESPDEARVWRILERLPTSDEMVLVDDTLEASRRVLLDQAYDIVRKMTVEALRGLAASARSGGDADRLEAAALNVPASLDQVAEADRILFHEVDLWRLVAILRDEASLPIDHDLVASDDLSMIERLAGDPGVAEGTADSLIQTMFDLSPVAFSISTIGENSSRYVRVNKAYLDLVGKTWESIRGQEMVSSGLVIDNSAREARLALLDCEGGYSAERASIRNADGVTVPVQISARRMKLAGKLFDFEVITDVSHP
ncbi:MAG: hypothetical protein K0M49_09900 [Arenimonas sp.]|nr:hypothetical protein [Arenimonas sp.]